MPFVDTLLNKTELVDAMLNELAADSQLGCFDNQRRGYSEADVREFLAMNLEK
jgi:hypothetical protein